MTGSAVRQVCYGVAALAGLILTWYFNLSYDGTTSYLAAWFVNDASSSAAVDLLVVSAAMSLFVVAESRRLGLRAYVPVLIVVAGFGIAMAFAVPLFLLLRERRLDRSPGLSGVSGAEARTPPFDRATRRGP